MRVDGHIISDTRPWRCPECGHEDVCIERGVAAFTSGECCRRDEPTKLTVDGRHVPSGGFPDA
jgi:hypothetical protein